MRELSIQEVQSVSGAGYLQDLTTYYGSVTGAMLGFSLGALVPIVAPITASVSAFIGSYLGSITGYAVGGISEAAISLVERFFGTKVS